MVRLKTGVETAVNCELARTRKIKEYQWMNEEDRHAAVLAAADAARLADRDGGDVW